MAQQQANAEPQETAPLSKKEQKAKDKAEKKAAKEAAKDAKKKKVKKVDPVKAAMRNMYRLAMAIAFGLVIWLGYEAFMIYASNMGNGGK